MAAFLEFLEIVKTLEVYGTTLIYFATEMENSGRNGRRAARELQEEQADAYQHFGSYKKRKRRSAV